MGLTVVINAADKDVAIKSSRGGFMGDTSEPELFMGNYHVAITKWMDRTVDNDMSMQIKLDDFDEVEAGMGTFMDDTFRQIPIKQEDSTVAGTLRVSRCDDKKLDEELGNWSYGQNRSKQDVVAALPTRALTRGILRALNVNGINGSYELKHLGGHGSTR